MPRFSTNISMMFLEYDLLDRFAAAKKAGFGAIEGVRDAMKPLPKEGVGLVITNYGKNIANSLNAMKMLAQVAGEEVPMLPMLAKLQVPSAAVLEKYLGWGAGVMLYQPGVGLIFDSNWRFKK